jgi:tape measure domain-containing protein
MAVSNVELRVDSRQAVNALQQVNRASGQADTATQKLTQSVNGTAAAMTRTGRELRTAANGMQYFIDATGRARKENGQFVTTAEAAAAGIERQGRAARNANAPLSTLGGTIGKLAGAFTAIQAARFVFAKTAEVETQTRSIQTLTGSVEQANQIIQELQQLGAATPFTSTELIETAKRLSAFGVAGNEVVEVTRRLGDVAGATSANLSELALVYGQVQAKGRLQGEELLQFQERGVALQAELQKMYGLTGEQFSKALSKGQISAEAVEVAIKRLTDTGGKYANGAIAQSTTLAGKFSTLQDGIEGIARTIGTALSPAIKAVLNEAIFAVNAINQLISTGARAKSFGLGQSQRKDILNQAQREAGQIVNMRRVANPFERNRQFQELAAQRERDLIEAYGIRTGQVKPAAAAPAMATAVPRLLGGGGDGGRKDGGGGRAGDAQRDAKAAAEELARVNSVVRERNADIELARIKLNLEDKITAAQAQGDSLTERRLQGQQRLVDIQSEYARLLADPQNQNARIQEVLTQQGLQALQAESLRTERDLQLIDQQRIKDGARLLADKQSELDLLKQTDPLKRDLLQIEQYLKSEEIAKLNLTQGQLDQLRKILTATAQIKNASSGLKSLYADIGMSLKSGIVDAIQGAIDGTKSLGDVASQVLRNIANKLLDVAINMALFGAMSGTGTGGGLLGGLFKPSPRAMGGSVRAGQPYLVGERGPELFMPGRSGGIAPTGSFGGGVNVVVNVDASGSSVQGDDQRANQLGRIVSVAVQQEIVKQKRPGGLLA